jgi:subtilisin family serine protease
LDDSVFITGDPFCIFQIGGAQNKYFNNAQRTIRKSTRTIEEETPMRKIISFVTIALIIAIGFAIFNTSSVYTAPKDGSVRVWVEFQPGKKDATQAALRGAGAQFHYTFDELNSFVVTLPAAALQGISRNPNVVSIEEDVPRYFIEPEPMALDDVGDPYTEEIVPYGIEAVQALEVWDNDNDGDIDPGAPTGEGVVVCIIDTGFYSDHEDLEADNLAGGTSQVDDDFETDGYGHGTHVAGTISAVKNEVGVVGVTPGTVTFYIVKIFGNDGLWVNGASDLVAAIYKCRDNDANIINMSLGGSSSSRKEERAFDSLYASGILSIAAAGNDAVDDPHYPASYESVISVAAVDEGNNQADFSNFGDHVELSAPGVDVWSTIPYIATNHLTVDGVTYAANHIEFSALGTTSGELTDGSLCSTTDPEWVGKVVLCERGDFSFAEKVLNVQSSGGTAAIIYNNEPGNFLGTMGEDSANIIAISLSQEDGQYLVANKQDFVGDVYAHLEQPASGYEAWGGTSMATPHVSGVAALIWSSDPSLTNVEIRDAMAATAYDLGDPGRDTVFGFGLVQAADAIAYLGGGSTNQPPTVTITNPSDGAEFDLGEEISFAGYADDLEDGDISIDLVWTSSIDGEIGTGASFSTELLSYGEHFITAEVVDSGGETGSAVINITVGDLFDPEDMHVEGIEMEYSKRGRNYTVYTTVTIQDETEAPVSGATVYLLMNLPDGGTTSRVGVTGADGIVTFSLSSRDTGEYISTVTDVTHSNYDWDGVEVYETLEIP